MSASRDSWRGITNVIRGAVAPGVRSARHVYHTWLILCPRAKHRCSCTVSHRKSGCSAKQEASATQTPRGHCPHSGYPFSFPRDSCRSPVPIQFSGCIHSLSSLRSRTLALSLIWLCPQLSPETVRPTDTQCSPTYSPALHLTCAKGGPAALTGPAGGLGELVGRHLVENPSYTAVAFVAPPRGTRWGFPASSDGWTQAVQHHGPTETTNSLLDTAQNKFRFGGQC